MYALYVEYPKYRGAMELIKEFYQLDNLSEVGTYAECKAAKDKLDPGEYTKIEIIRLTPVTKK